MSMSVDGTPCERWRGLKFLLQREGHIVGPGFEPGPELLEFLQNDCRFVLIFAGDDDIRGFDEKRVFFLKDFGCGSWWSGL